MKKIGLSSTSLFAIGITEHSDVSFELLSEIMQNELLRRRPEEFRIERSVAKEEALILAVAKMIEANNAALLKQLKSAGVLPDQ